MSFRIFTIGVAALVCAVPAAAQQRGTVEFGAFGSLGSFDKALTLNRGYGGGGRIGAFLEPRVAVEFEKGEMRATRTLGLKDVNVGILTGRLVVTLEEHSVVGGLGGAVAEWLSEQARVPARLLRIGTPDRFFHDTGNQSYARQRLGLDAESVTQRIVGALSSERWD